MVESGVLLETIRQINRKIRDDDIPNIDLEEDFPFQNNVEFFGELLDSNVYLIAMQGDLLGYYSQYDIFNSERTRNMIDQKKLADEYLEQLARMAETEANIDANDERTILASENRTQSDAVTTIIPIYGGPQKLGYLIFGRPEPLYDDADLILAEYVATVLALELAFLKRRKEEEAAQRRELVESAVDSLSFTELKAIRKIFDEGEKKPVFEVTSSKVADKYHFSRSLIVTALRKMESAGLLVSHSRGMRGTVIDTKSEENYREIYDLLKKKYRGA